MSTILRAARLFDGSRLIADAFVVLGDGRVEAVGRWADASDLAPPSLRRNADIVNFGDRTIVPGLVDSHAHLCLGGGPNAIEDPTSLPRAALEAHVRSSAGRAVRAGVTTVRDCGDWDGVVVGVRERLIAPQILAYGTPITIPGGHCHGFGMLAESAGDLVAAVRQQHHAGADGVKIMATGGRLTPGSLLGTAQYSVEQLGVVVAEAHRLGMKVAAHVLGTEGIRHAVAAGVDTLEHVSWIGKDGRSYAYDDALVEEICRKSLTVSVSSAQSRDEYLALLGRSRATHNAERMDRYLTQADFVNRMFKAGAHIVINDDAGCPGVDIADFPLSVATLGICAGLPPIEVLEMVTSNALVALGLDDGPTCVAPGRPASLLVVEGNPAEDLHDLTRTACVFVGRRMFVPGRERPSWI